MDACVNVMPRRSNRLGDNSGSGEEGLNPYVALSDLVISVILIVVFFVALGQLGLINVQYEHDMDDFAAQVRQLPEQERPDWEKGRNDPPGVQRWIFAGSKLFLANTASGSVNGAVPTTTLTASGQHTLDSFARLLKSNQSKWRRVRIEGHTQPPREGEMDDWELSASRAAVVARQIQTGGGIPSWFLAVAGRAGQNHLYKVIVYYRPNEPQSTSVLQRLNAAGISFSARNVTSDPEARRDFSIRRLTSTPTVLIQDSDEKEQQVSLTGDNDHFSALAQKWARNDRVEVLVEYSKNAAGQ